MVRMHPVGGAPRGQGNARAEALLLAQQATNTGHCGSSGRRREGSSTGGCSQGQDATQEQRTRCPWSNGTEDDEYGVAVQHGRTEDIREIALPSAQSCCELEITRQNKTSRIHPRPIASDSGQNTKVDPPHTPQSLLKARSNTPPARPSSTGFGNRRGVSSRGPRQSPASESGQPPAHPAPKAPGGNPAYPSSPGQLGRSGCGSPRAHMGSAARAPPHPLPGSHGGTSHPHRGAARYARTAGIGGHVGDPGPPGRPHPSPGPGLPSGRSPAAR
uniref:Uncharacterized protein n=1 Tax=Rangifer tarandus platyrhynchus TaxID=3082113 RepID=A0ACB0EQP9_RANTA|nr:unnamed protein product [Rangifer tarandus platyrhynchus]